eukprot:scaffold84545_cov43-Prasinocladus_malaysianus.AAC.1
MMRTIGTFTYYEYEYLPSPPSLRCKAVRYGSVSKCTASNRTYVPGITGRVLKGVRVPVPELVPGYVALLTTRSTGTCACTGVLE